MLNFKIKCLTFAKSYENLSIYYYCPTWLNIFTEIFIELKTLEYLSKNENQFLLKGIKLFHNNNFLWKMKMIPILESPFHLLKKWGFRNLIYYLLVTRLPFKCYLNIYEHALINWFILHKDFSEWHENVSSLFDDHSSEKGKQLFSKRTVLQCQKQKIILDG